MFSPFVYHSVFLHYFMNIFLLISNIFQLTVDKISLYYTFKGLMHVTAENIKLVYIDK